MRNSTIFLTLICSLLLISASLVLHAQVSRAAGANRLEPGAGAQAQAERPLPLYRGALTRHPAMADHHAAFQDHPMALEHFPSGSLVSPPDLRRKAP